VTNRAAAPGRPPVTSHAAIEQAAFALFEQHGFARIKCDGRSRP